MKKLAVSSWSNPEAWVRLSLLLTFIYLSQLRITIMFIDLVEEIESGLYDTDVAKFELEALEACEKTRSSVE